MRYCQIPSWALHFCILTREASKRWSPTVHRLYYITLDLGEKGFFKIINHLWLFYNFIFFIILFLIEQKLLYNIVLVLPYVNMNCFWLFLQYACMLSCVWLFATPYSRQVSSVHRIFQARILEWVAISFSRGSSPPKGWTHVSCISCIGRWIRYHYCHLGSPGEFFTNWATKDFPLLG